MAHRVHHRTGTGKNPNGALGAPVDGKGLVQLDLHVVHPVFTDEDHTTEYG
jgi:hypothetical protein